MTVHIRPRLGVIAALLFATMASTASAATADGRHLELISGSLGPGKNVLAMFPDVSPDGNSAVFTAELAQPGSVQGGYNASFVAQRDRSSWRASDASLPGDTAGPAVPNLSIVRVIPPGADHLIVGALGQHDPSSPVANPAVEHAFVTTPGSRTGRALLRPPFQDSTVVPLPGQQTLSSVFLRPPPGTPAFQAADGTQVTADTIARLDSNGVSVASRLPGGEATDAQSVAQEAGAVAYGFGVGNRATSDDGKRLFFYAYEGSARQDQPLDGFGVPLQQLYVRDGDQTVALSRSAIDGEVKAARFLGSSADGDVSYLVSNESLDAGHSGAGVYRYRLSTRSLDRLTPSSGTATIDDLKVGAANAFASRDGSSVYFTSPAALTGNAQDGGVNAYVWRGGSLRFIADLGPGGELWSTSQDGNFAVLRSAASLGGAATGGFSQVYRYAYGDARLQCASCRPDGAPSQGESSFQLPPNLAPDNGVYARPRAVSNDGHVFFTASDRLVADDLSTAPDAYEFDGSGPRLLSDGRGKSYVADNSDDGSSIFILSFSSLTADDRDGGFNDLYVRRAGEDLVRPVPTAPCVVGACQLAPLPQAQAPPSASRGVGEGNVKPPAKVKPALLSGPLLSSAAKRSLARGRTASVRVRLRGQGRLSIRGTARVRSRSRTVLSAAARGRKSERRTAILRIRLSAAARAELRRKGSLSIRLELRLGTSSSRTTTTLRGAGR